MQLKNEEEKGKEDRKDETQMSTRVHFSNTLQSAVNSLVELAIKGPFCVFYKYSRLLLLTPNYMEGISAIKPSYPFS